MVGLEYNLHLVELQSGDGEAGHPFFFFVCYLHDQSFMELLCFFLRLLLRKQNYPRLTIL